MQCFISVSATSKFDNNIGELFMIISHVPTTMIRIIVAQDISLVSFTQLMRYPDQHSKYILYFHTSIYPLFNK